jgi:1-deoxy-D-xylulose 5-phosphate reductoisomerase
LDGRIAWTAIAQVVEATLDRYDAPARSVAGDPAPRTIDDVLEADGGARRVARQVVAGREAA